ncbi:MAG TPA: pyridoxamine 5'-phosphate oxidase family protein [Acidimicrobiia bacterium]|nr:pyridoxamine 5'-phosphate oxidase family protein [Acidimicrobiia bacterium]
MIDWTQFATEAPRISEIFRRRHAATAKLCLLATIRSDGSPRISPIEPNIFEDQLVLVGMPGTTKFRDLDRDPRFCVHTATTDPYVGEGDAKLWGSVVNLQDKEFHHRFTDELFRDQGLDLRGDEFDPFYVGDIASASSVELEDNRLRITIWKPGEGERAVFKN